MENNNLKIITYDVEHGSCHLIITPNGQYIMIDAGSKANFSPSLQVRKYGVTNLRWFILTHHDSDHLTDVENLFKEIKPTTIERIELSREELLPYYNGVFTDYQEQFFKNTAEYVVHVEPINSLAYDWGGVQFFSFQNKPEDFETKNANNLSIVTFVDYAGWTFLFPGDLESEGWKKLLEKEEFVELLKRTDVLIASHHGRESGYCEDIFSYCSPNLTIISDKSSSETSVTEKYSSKSNGLEVRDSFGSVSIRKALATRSDGAIKIEITKEGRHAIDLFPT